MRRIVLAALSVMTCLGLSVADGRPAAPQSTAAADASRAERDCATEIVRRLPSNPFRRPVTDVEFADLMRFYESGRAEGDFEGGVAAALEAVLASPRSLFKLEAPAPPAATRPAGTPYRLRDIDLASRLSFFV